jgi:hypothetical protein
VVRRRAGTSNTGKLRPIWAGVVLALSTGASQAAASERVTIPFACQPTSGRAFALTPSAPRAYEIVGVHDVRHMAICNPSARLPGSVGCKTVNLHRFDLQCGSKRVPWPEVASAIAAFIPPLAPYRPRLQTISQPVPMSRPAQPDCRLARRDPTGRMFISCRWPDWRPISLAAELPHGFAPMAEVGGKLQAAAQPGAIKTAERSARKPEPLVTTQPLPDITPALYDGAPLEAITVAQRQPIDMSTDTGLSGAFVAFGLLLLSSLATAGAAWRWPEQALRVRRVAARSGLRGIETVERWALGARSSMQRVIQTVRPAPSSPRPMRDVKAANAASAVAALLTDTTARLADLKGAGPLSDVLQQEVSGLRQRLATLELAASESEEAAGRASPGFRNLMRDIERVRRIADSAAVSMGGGRNAARVPKTRSEAFDLLGLNPDAPEGTLKKVADGLRMSWHPDHARDDADRAEREARIKAINIAIDLINGKRAVA